MKFIGFVLSLFGILCIVSTARAELNIEITQGIAAAVPIAVVSQSEHTRYDTPSFEDLAEVIRSDLRISGHFRPLTKAQMPKIGNNDTPNFDAWQSLKVENIITGALEKTGSDRYTVSFKLWDVFQSQADGSPQKTSGLLTAKEYTGISQNQFRALAHHISDEIYERLTGVRGAFSTRIAYVIVSSQNGRLSYRLDVSDMDGHNPMTLVKSKQPLMSPAWSSDGKRLSFVSFEKNRAEIYMINVVTGHRELLTKFKGINGAPAWSPDGRKMAIVLSKEGSPKIYLLDVATLKTERLTDGTSIDTEPTWSSDGESLYFTSDRGGKPQIYKMDLISRVVSRVTYSGNYNARPKVSSDGKYLVMIHKADRSNFQIATQNLRTGEVKILTHASSDESPSLSPNGAMVLYGTKEYSKGVLGLVTIDGRGHLRLPAREGSVQEPAWSPYLS